MVWEAEWHAWKRTFNVHTKSTLKSIEDDSTFALKSSVQYNCFQNNQANVSYEENGPSLPMISVLKAVGMNLNGP